MIVVGDIVRNRGDLRFQARPAAELQVPVGVRFGHRPGRGTHGSVVLGEPFKRFPAEVQAIEVGIRRLEPGHDADRMGVMVKPARILERCVEGILPGMAERRVAEVVGEA